MGVTIAKQKYIPETFRLFNNYPNPSNPVTTIVFTLPVGGDASLVIFNMKGEQVANLFSGFQSAGSHRLVWDASDAASGIYLYRLQVGDFIETKKMVLLK